MLKQHVLLVVVVVVAAIVCSAYFYLVTYYKPSIVPLKKYLVPPTQAINYPSPFPPTPHSHNPPTTHSKIHYPPPPPPFPPLPPFPSFLTSPVAPHLPYARPGLANLTAAPPVFKDLPLNLTDAERRKYKIILYWNEMYSNKYFGFGYGRQPFVLAGCRVNTCIATGDRGRYPISEVDAVLWHLRSNDKSLPKTRYAHTRYVLVMMESALHIFADLERYKGLFNTTFTYRRDSDVYNPYGRLFLRRHPLPLPSTPPNYAQGKTKMAAWFVSNCNSASAREKLVKQLTKWMEVDVYGKCGQLECVRKEHEKCLNMLGETYKFYFSFENSLCQDYVTEKFFGALNVNVVPVVWGLGNYSAIAPPHSYINALNFPTAHHLANYLLYLNANDTAYNEYFWWKPYYHQIHDWAKKSMAFCDLCEQLHHDLPPKTYDLKQWFKDDSHCLTSSHTTINTFIRGKK